MLCPVSANILSRNSFDHRALFATPPGTPLLGTGRSPRQHQEGSGRGTNGSGPRFAEQFHYFVDSNAQLARRTAKGSSAPRDEADRGRTRSEDASEEGPVNGVEDKRPERPRSNSARAFPLWNPMWHAIPVPAKAIAADPSGDGPASGDFGFREPGVGNGQGDTLSADANFLTGLISSLEPARAGAGEQSASRDGSPGSSASGEGNPPPGTSKRDGAELTMMPSLPNALPLAFREPVTGEQRGDGELREESTLLTNLHAEPGETHAGTNGPGGAALTTDLIPIVKPMWVSGLAPLMTNAAVIPPAILTPLATLTENREAPDAEKLEKRVLDGTGSGNKTAPEGSLLDARDWLRVEHPPQPVETPPAWNTLDRSSTEPNPVAISSPIPHLPVSDEMSRPPVPTSTVRPSPHDGRGPMMSLAGVNAENALPGNPAIQDPVSFVVRVAAERPPLGGSSPEVPKPSDPGTHAGSFPGTGDGPSLEKSLGRAREGSFDRVGKDPGTVVPVRSMAALGSSVGGQTEGGDPHQNPFAREESSLPNAIPRAGGERDFASWVPGHGADHFAGMAGQPTRNESGSETGVTTAKLHETAEPARELAPERLTAAPRELVLTIPGTSDGEGVLASVHVRDHNGAVEIAVRTPDAQLSSSLQDGLPELVARLETQGTTANAMRGDQMSGGAADGGPTDWSGTQDGQRQERQPPEGQTGQETSGGGRDERHQHSEDRGQPRGQPGSQVRELRQQRQARWHASLGLASR